MHRLRGAFFLLAMTLSCGCGSDHVATYPVNGKVMFTDGVPVKSGTVELQSLEQGTTATGTIKDDGTFILGTYSSDDGAVAGKHRAIVVQLIIADGVTLHHKNHGLPVNPAYGDYDKSGLTADVQPVEKNDIVLTIELTKR